MILKSELHIIKTSPFCFFLCSSDVSHSFSCISVYLYYNLKPENQQGLHKVVGDRDRQEFHKTGADDWIAREGFGKILNFQKIMTLHPDLVLKENLGDIR